MVTLKPPGLRATSHAAPTVRRVATIVLAAFVAAVMTGGTQSQASPFAPQVNTAQGEVVGLLDDQIAKFLGIPYAAPPIGDLRLAPPQAHTDWASPLQATQYGNPCPQTPRLGSGSSNEDCLFLNVYTPAFEAPKRPVLVFIHGGSFNAGNGGVTVGSPSYDGGDISRKSGAVVVTMNYRLSILGFLANAGLDKDNGRPSGNYVRHPGPAASAALGPGEHSILRRRSGQRHDLRRECGRDFGTVSLGLTRQRRPVQARDRGEQQRRRLPVARGRRDGLCSDHFTARVRSGQRHRRLPTRPSRRFDT